MEGEESGMKSLHERFDAFKAEMYPGVGPKGTQAMRRSFLLGYMTAIQHTQEIVHEKDVEIGLGKIMALGMSAESFKLDCEK